MESAVVGTKGQVVIPKRIRAMLHMKPGTRVYFEARAGEIVLILRLAPRPKAVGSLRIPPLTPRYFEHMAGCLGTGGKALKVLLEEKKKERAL